MSPLPGIYASQISGHLSQPTGAYDSLATIIVPSGGAASVTFAGIPAGYKHLEMHSLARLTFASGAGDIDLVTTFNDDSSANYSVHYSIYGGGASSGPCYSSAIANNNYVIGGCTTRATATSGLFGVGILTILDYADTNKYKTARTLHGNQINSNSSNLYLTSSNWRSYSAVTSITLAAYSSNFVEFSRFELYGVK